MYLLINSFFPFFSLETISLKGATLDRGNTCVVKTWVQHIQLKRYPHFQGEPTFSPPIRVAGTNSIGAARKQSICVGEVKQYK